MNNTEHVTPAFEDECEPYDTGTVEDYDNWDYWDWAGVSPPAEFSPLPGTCWICDRQFQARWGQVVCDDCGQKKVR